MTLHITCGFLGIPRYITLIYNRMVHSSDVANMTHDRTRHDNAGMFMLQTVSMSSYSAAKWWMCSWCITTSPLHSKVCRVFDGLGVCLMLHVHVSPLFLLWHDSHVCPFAKTSPRMHRPLLKNIIASTLLVHSVCCDVMSHPRTCIYNRSWRDDIKSINLLVYHDSLSFAFRCKWPRERTRLWNCARQVSSWDAGSKRYWWKLLRSHLETEMDNLDQHWLSAGFGSGGGKIYVIFWGKQCM